VLHNSMTEADKVLKELKPLLKKELDFQLEPYANGRERGWSIVRSSDYRKGIQQVRVSFSEARGSDSIVVYSGDALWFDGHNCPSARLFDQSTTFRPGHYLPAAKFIAKFLNDRSSQ